MTNNSNDKLDIVAISKFIGTHGMPRYTHKEYKLDKQLDFGEDEKLDLKYPEEIRIDKPVSTEEFKMSMTNKKLKATIKDLEHMRATQYDTIDSLNDTIKDLEIFIATQNETIEKLKGIIKELEAHQEARIIIEDVYKNCKALNVPSDLQELQNENKVLKKLLKESYSTAEQTKWN